MKWYYALAYRRTRTSDGRIGCRFIIRRPRWFWTLFVHLCLLSKGDEEVPFAADFDADIELSVVMAEFVKKIISVIREKSRKGYIRAFPADLYPCEKRKYDFSGNFLSSRRGMTYFESNGMDMHFLLFEPNTMNRLRGLSKRYTCMNVFRNDGRDKEEWFNLLTMKQRWYNFRNKRKLSEIKGRLECSLQYAIDNHWGIVPVFGKAIIPTTTGHLHFN